LSFFTRLRRLSNQRGTTVEDDPATDAARPWRRVAGLVVTVLAIALVVAALLLPNKLSLLTPTAFLRLPVELLLGVALVIVLPARARRVVAVLLGAGLGLVTVLKFIDIGFYAVLARSFHPVYDWTMFQPAVEFLGQSTGEGGATVAVVVAAVLVVALFVLLALSALRLTRLVVAHRTRVARVVGVVAVAAVVCAAFGVKVVPDRPASALAFNRLLQVRADLRDQDAFAAEAAVDAFRDTPGEQMLTGLRGKDVLLVFVESYGRDAVEDRRYAPQVNAVLADGERRLRADGFGARSAFLTSSTNGGSSWLAHGTLLSGLWINNQQRYRALVGTDRLTLNGAFRRAGWRTVGVMPGVSRAWPEGRFFGYDRIYAGGDLGYKGPRFPLHSMPDQFTLSSFQRQEHGVRDQAPVMAEIPLTSSHAGWTPIPRLVGWDAVGDGSIFNTAKDGAQPREEWRDPDRIRTDYRRCIEYSLNTLVSYVETYGDDDLVLVFLGDHQPVPMVTGKGATRDVPITIVARDTAVLDRIAGWGWHDGLKPPPDAPLWRMDTFRDRFLTAYGSRPSPSGPPAPTAE
jgi:hypothetical protein